MSFMLSSFGAYSTCCLCCVLCVRPWSVRIDPVHFQAGRRTRPPKPEFSFFLLICVVVFAVDCCMLAFAMLGLVTFCVSRRRRKMCCGHVRLCVCLRPYAHITARTRM